MASRRRSRIAALVVAVLALSAVRCHAAIAFDASATTCQTGSGTSLSCSFGVGKPTSTALVIVTITATSNAAAVTINTPTDNQSGNVYTLAQTKCTNNSCVAGTAKLSVYFALNVNVSGTYTVSEGATTCTGTCEISIGLMSFTGVATASATDGGITDSGNSTTRDGGSFTTTNATDVIVMGGADVVSSTLTAGAGYTSPAGFNITNNLNQNLFGEYQIVAATSTYNPNLTGATTGGWAGVDEAFKASAGGAACTPTLTLLNVGRCG